MKAWTELAHETAASKFPDFGLLHAFSVFSASQKAENKKNSKDRCSKTGCCRDHRGGKQGGFVA
eukprot:2175778-Prorocentrum_lima.AAC.1